MKKRNCKKSNQKFLYGVLSIINSLQKLCFKQCKLDLTSLQKLLEREHILMVTDEIVGKSMWLAVEKTAVHFRKGNDPILSFK